MATYAQLSIAMADSEGCYTEFERQLLRTVSSAHSTAWLLLDELTDMPEFRQIWLECSEERKEEIFAAFARIVAAEGGV